MTPEELETLVVEMTPFIVGPVANDSAFALRFMAKEIERRTRNKAESLIRDLASNFADKMGQ